MDGRMGVWRLKGVRPGCLGHLDVWIAMGNQHSIPNGVSMTPRSRAEQRAEQDPAAHSPRTFVSAVAGRGLVLPVVFLLLSPTSGDMQVGGWVTNTIFSSPLPRPPLRPLCDLSVLSVVHLLLSLSLDPFPSLSFSPRLLPPGPASDGTCQWWSRGTGNGVPSAMPVAWCPFSSSSPPSSHLPGRACLRRGRALDRRTRPGRAMYEGTPWVRASA